MTGSGDTEITPAILKALQGKKSLKRFAIAYAKISNESAEVLATLKSLESLELRVQLELSPNGLEELLKLTSLKELTLSDRLANDFVLEDLTRLPVLKTLTVRSLFVTDDGLAALKRLKSLQVLRF